MLPSVILDPSAFWLFEEHHATEEFVIKHLQRALQWLQPGREFDFDLLISHSSVLSLESLGMFPAEPYFKRLLQAAGLDHVVTPKQLAAYVARFLATAHTVEDTQQVSEAIFNSVDIDPDLTLCIDDSKLREISVHNIGLAALNITDSKSLFYAICCCTADHGRIKVQSDAAMIEVRTEENQVENPNTKTVPIIRDPIDYAKHLTPEQVWQYAENDEELHLAIRLEAQKFLGAEGKSLLSFAIGAGFRASLANCEASGSREYASVVRRRCAQIVAQSKGLSINDFHTSSKRAQVRVRSSDNASAKRMHLTEKHQALRLMFWEKNDKSIEFANVGNKFDEEIFD